MNFLLKISRFIDWLTERVGRSIIWLVLAAVLISAVNAVVRKAFNISSNAFLELQWYLFSAIFLLGGAYALLHNEHVRIDLVVGKLSPRGHAWVDIFGTLFFLLPMAVMVLWLSSHFALSSFQSQEMSPNAGGLIVWPAKALIPLGFLLLVLQGMSELIKRVAFLKGLIADPAEKHKAPTAEEELIEELRRRQMQEEGK
ncbi:MAG: TRAP transporter small permease subunit [Pseudomonadota bacterium]